MESSGGCAASEPFALRVLGDSMLPEFRPGDLVHLADPSFLPPSNGDIVVVIKDGEATVKKYKLKNDKIILIPLNKKYREFSSKDAKIGES